MRKEAMPPLPGSSKPGLLAWVASWFWKGKAPLHGWKGVSKITRGMGRPLIGYGIPGTYLLGHSGATNITPSAVLKEKPPGEPVLPSRSPFVGAAVGAATAGLGSLLYGKLKDEPNLRRDLIATLVGGAFGVSYQLLKSGADTDDIEIYDQTGMLDKEAWGMAAAKAVGLVGLFAGVPYFMGKGESEDEERRHNEALDMAKEHLKQQAGLQLSIDRTRRGAGGAIVGTLAGGTFSRLLGKYSGNKSLRRDIVYALTGAAIGGAVGVYSA